MEQVRTKSVEPQQRFNLSEGGPISILLVGENLQRCTELHRWLDNQRLRCECAASYQGAYSRISRRQFDLVISEHQLPDRAAFPLLDLLAGSPTTLFFSQALDNDFLWLLMLDRGRRCIGAPIVRSSNLHGALDRVLYTIETARELEDLADELTSTPFLDSVGR
jgi:CheY-like chemotaxis protein